MSTQRAMAGLEEEPATSRRSLAPDIARGAMLLLIALANVSAFLWTREGPIEAPPRSLLDQVFGHVLTIAVDGRAVPMFAFLFGYGMIQFQHARLARGFPEKTVRRFLLRRHLALILLGLLHAAALFYGDVLGSYGFLGVLLVALFLCRSDRTVLVWIVLFMLPVLIVGIIYAVGAVMVPDTLVSVSGDGASFSVSGLIRAAVGDVPYVTSIWGRVRIWLITTLPIPISQLPACIMLGWLAARRRVLDDPRLHRRLLTRFAVIGIALGWGMGLVDVLAQTHVLPLDPRVDWGFISIGYVSGTAAGIGYAAVFGLVATRYDDVPAAERPLPVRATAAMGSRSLTFYLWQSVAFAPLLSGWGLGLGEHLGTTASLALALAVWCAGLPAALWLERRGHRGPAEVLLRRLSYGNQV